MTTASEAAAATAPGRNSRTEEIRSIAAGLFERRGYSATTMADIGSAAGVLPGSLYHHFESKEVIAVELLSALEADLVQLGNELASADRDTAPELRLRHLVSAVIALSYRHAAAVRLLAYEPPTVATSRLGEAVKLTGADGLDRLWRNAIDELADGTGASASDIRLLRVALQTLSIDASVNHPTRPDPSRLAEHLCDLMLRGIATSVDSALLDRSEALAVAKREVASWGPRADGPGDQENVRDKIVAAARLEFARRGYDATTVRDIATSANVTMGTLYRRATSKDALVGEIIESYASHFNRAIRAVLTTGSSLVESLDALIWVYVHGARRFREESDIVKVGWSDRESVTNPFYEYFRATEERLALLRNALDEGVREGSVKPITAASDVAAHFRFAMWLPYQDEARTSAERAHAFLRQTMLRGFLNSAEEPQPEHRS